MHIKYELMLKREKSEDILKVQNLINKNQPDEVNPLDDILKETLTGQKLVVEEELPQSETQQLISFIQTLLPTQQIQYVEEVQQDGQIVLVQKESPVEKFVNLIKNMAIESETLKSRLKKLEENKKGMQYHQFALKQLLEKD